MLGVTQGYITHVESGRRKVSARKAVEFEAKTGGELNSGDLLRALFNGELCKPK